MRPNTHLRSAIDKAYLVFSGYGRPVTLQASPLRDGMKILRDLTQVPLREVTADVIGPYAFCALTTVGEVHDYKHFLPRIFEQAVLTDDWIGTSPAIIADRLQRAGWRHWPARERQVVADIFLSAWQQSSRTHPDEVNAADWLCGLALLEFDIGSLLDRWLSPVAREPALQVANFLSIGGVDASLWKDVPHPTRHIVVKWLSHPEVEAALNAALDGAEVEEQWLLRLGLGRIYGG